MFHLLRFITGSDLRNDLSVTVTVVMLGCKASELLHLSETSYADSLQTPFGSGALRKGATAFSKTNYIKRCTDIDIVICDTGTGFPRKFTHDRRQGRYRGLEALKICSIGIEVELLHSGRVEHGSAASGSAATICRLRICDRRVTGSRLRETGPISDSEGYLLSSACRDTHGNRPVPRQYRSAAGATCCRKLSASDRAPSPLPPRTSRQCPTRTG